jgi:DNA topoisomerase-1
VSKTLLIVESPNKAKTMRNYVDSSILIEASFGHIRDMPKSYGVDLTTFQEEYEIREDRAKQRVAMLKKLAREAGRVIIATDPDREGEGIAWHLCEVMGLDVRTTGRILLHEINKSALAQAMQSPGRVDLHRVDAQRSRRILDRIVGYDVSGEICQPANARSAGRVQTPALHILCELERKILAFVPKRYWTLSAEYREGFTAHVAAASEAEAESEGDEFTREDTSGSDSEGRLRRRVFEDEAEATRVLAEIQANTHAVQDLSVNQVSKSPPAVYDTAECMADAGRKLKLSAKETTQQLQTLFEAGYITYHRTDSTRVSPQAVQMARDHIQQVRPQALGPLGSGATGKGGAQDAHEGIRPTALVGDTAPPSGTVDLYTMVKARFLASQSKPARFERTRIVVKAGSVELVADGSVLIEEGYLFFWGPYAKQDDEILPKVQAGQTLDATKCEAKEKKTTPPSRLDSAGLTKKLKASGLGRPSTYANIIETLLARGYAANVKIGRKVVMQPTELGMRVDEMLAECLPDLVSEEYTADMEAKLEEIERGGLSRTDYLREWHVDFRSKMEQAREISAEYRRRHNIVTRAAGQPAGEPTTQTCDRCGETTYVKVARKGGGHFLACPACRMTRDLKAKIKKGACKTCGSNLIERQTSQGKAFFGCVRYGAAERPCSYVESNSRYSRVELDQTCPLCKKFKVVQLVPNDPKDGSPFKVCGDPERDREKRCKYIESEGKYRREATGQRCPGCGKHDLVLLSPRDEKDGSPFKACSDPTRICRFLMDAEAQIRAEPCPECGKPVVEKFRRPTPEEKRKGQKGKSFWACSGYPSCRFAADKEKA